jgi:hypothetical protein
LNQKKTELSKLTIVLACLAIVSLIGLSASLIVYWQQNGALQEKDNQIASLQDQLSTPKLVSIGLQYSDNRSNTNAPFLHVTGYVVNVGNAKANNCTIHVNAIQNGHATALDTTAIINPLDADAYEVIDLQFPYTGQALVEAVYSSSLSWTT